MIDRGVSEETIILLLMLPIVATIIAFARQVIGIKGFGIYTPLIISFAFLATGLKYGLAFFIIIILIGTLARLVVKRFRLLYLPRMAIVLTAVAISIFAVFLEGAYSGRNGLTAASIFAIIVMITLVEKFIASQIERGRKEAIILTIETLILSIICYLIAIWPWLRDLVLTYPIIIITGTIIINVLLGKWTGLRISEYARFRKIIKSIEPSEKK